MSIEGGVKGCESVQEASCAIMEKFWTDHTVLFYTNFSPDRRCLFEGVTVSTSKEKK